MNERLVHLIEKYYTPFDVKMKFNTYYGDETEFFNTLYFSLYSRKLGRHFLFHYSLSKSEWKWKDKLVIYHTVEQRGTFKTIRKGITLDRNYKEIDVF